MFKKILALILSTFYFSASIADVKNNLINNFSDAIDNSKYIVDDKSKIIFNKDKDAIILQNVNSNEL